MRFQPPEPGYSGFIFDCDGTLADSMPLHYLAWQQALKEHHAPFEFTWSLFTSRAGMTQECTARELNRQFGCQLDAARVAQAQQEHFACALHLVTPVPGVVEFARQMALAHPVSVASGGERSAVERTLRIIGADDLFGVVVVAADVTHGKPAPDLFLLAARRMGVPPAQCVVFEDSELGVAAARAAGMAAVWVTSEAPPGSR